MVIVRAARLEDLEQLWQLIEQATYGLTTLQITQEQLSERIELSNFAFNRQPERPLGEPYVFVMEDTLHGQLVGLSCIFSKTGGYEPFYSYERKVETHHCEVLDKTQHIESLHLAKIHDGPTEIGSLFLSPEYRGQGRGRLLSLSRFAFMAAHPQRFASEVIAEMRGVLEEDGNSLFWEAIGRVFFDIDFPQADSLSTINKRFIEDLMPRYPIYVAMLPEEVQKILGQVHEHTRPALAMLQMEGFSVIDMIDIFDGGPVVSCSTHQIQAVKRTRQYRIADIQPNLTGEDVIVSSDSGGFRAMLGVALPETPNADDRQLDASLVLDQTAALSLHVKIGDSVRLTPPYPEPKPKEGNP